MNLQVLRSGYLLFSTLPFGYTYFFLLCHPIGPNFGCFSAITPVNKVGFCWNFDQSYSSWISNDHMTCFENIEFLRPQDVPKVFSFGPYLGPIYSPKTQYFLKNKNFSRNYILRTIAWPKPQVPDKSENSYKIFQKTPFFGLKIGQNCPLGPAQGVHTNSHVDYNRTIYPWFMNLQVLRSGYLLFSTLPFRYTYFFFALWPNWA